MPSFRLSCGAMGGLLLLSQMPLQALEFKSNGFFTAGMQVSDAKDRVTSNGAKVLPNYDAATAGGISSKPNTNYDTLLGLQVEGKYDDKMSFVAQFLAPGYNQYKVEASWAFARYNFNEHVSGRVGRLRLPAFLVSEYLQVGYAYPWITPPRDVYSQIPISFANYTGADLTLRTNWHEQDLSLTVYGGNATNGANDTAVLNPTAATPIAVATSYNTTVRNILGASVSAGNEILSLKGNYVSGKLSLSPLPNTLQLLQTQLNTSGFGTQAQQLSTNDKSFYVYGVGYKFDWKNVTSLAEYTRVRYSNWLPDSMGWYANIGYRIHEKLLPSFTFSRFKTTRTSGFNFLPGPFQAQPKSGLYKAEDSIIMALRYDVVANAAIKASWTQVKPKRHTAGLFDTIPAKAKQNLFGLALNVVF